MFPAEMKRHTNCMATAYWAERDRKSFCAIVPALEKNQTEEQRRGDLLCQAGRGMPAINRPAQCRRRTACRRPHLTHPALAAPIFSRKGQIQWAMPNPASARFCALPALESKYFFQEKIMDHQQFQSCMDACNACATACDYCAISCLQEANPKPMARCIALDMDCAQICRLATAFMARNSELAGRICQVCAEVCDACGEECAKHQMAHCQACAQACRECAEECRNMAGAHPAGRQSAGAGTSAHH